MGFGFDVDTPGNYFSYIGSVIESGFDDFSDPFNSLNVTADIFPGIPDDNVLLATLYFSADSVGTDYLALDGSYDGLFYGLFYEISGFDLIASTSITVVASAVPEPEPLLLLGAGLLILAINKRVSST